MKTLATLFLVFVLGVLNAQLVRGGFGYGFSGPWLMADSRLQDELNSPSLLGSNLQQVYFGVSGGGSGYVLLANRLVIGGTGFSYNASDATSRGQLTTKIRGGIGQIGYVIIQRNKIMAFPYAGVGNNNAKMKIRNNTSNDLFDLGSLNVAPGESVELQASTVDFDMGLSLQYLAFRHRNPARRSGLMIGMQAGAMIFGGIDDWHLRNESAQVAGALSKPAIFTPYFRISIGGGGFRLGGKDEITTRL
jgi:hypothetical protein